jgi:hypothetical protein
MKSNLHIALLIASTIIWSAGCCSPEIKITPYTGATDSMAKVVTDINVNDSKVPTLVARHYFDANVVDQKGRSNHAHGDGILLFIAPTSLRLTANAVIGSVFELGSNPDRFWLKLGPDAGDTMWWGNYGDLAKMNPDDAGIPVRPDMILDVLGIATIGQNFNAPPVPVMRFDPYADAYIFVWNSPLADRWVAQREVWYDRQTKLPKLILIYDTTGRIALRATFGPKEKDGRPVFQQNNYRRVEVAGLPKAQWPWIPKNYNLFFPANGSLLQFTLDSASLSEQQGARTLPDPARSFKMPNPQSSGVTHVIQVGVGAGDR